MKFKNTIKNCKRRGEWAELEFMAAAAKHGLQVVKPMGDSASYDAAIETGGHFVRVQVKSTTALRPEGCYKCNIRPASGLPYKPGDFDFIAIYVIPEDLWYIIPANRVVGRNKKTAILLYTANSTGRWVAYREAWPLIPNRHRPRRKPAAAPRTPPAPNSANHSRIALDRFVEGPGFSRATKPGW